ncbi:hypothetical protein HG530_003878 [Fusarium avenaceum]|nr:hypothetical protein DER45DRAFT_641963 [Fusarium avenaceum]KAI6772920.1 hypothetical protein HG530_003878 [Fusarium avenaceum]
MKFDVAILFLHFSAANGVIYNTLFPSERPAVTEDPIDCIFEDFYPYFSALTPNGSLSTALLSYADVLMKDCPLTDTDVMGLATCPYPALSDWCSFSDHAPTSLLPAWSSYGSSASSWWASNSAHAVKYARICKKKWFNQMIGVVYGSVRLNNTIHWGECFAQAHVTLDGKVAATTTATTGMKATPMVPKETKGTSRDGDEDESNGNGCKARSLDARLFAGIGFVAAVLNHAM